MQRAKLRRLTRLRLFGALFLAAPSGLAAGFDTPILYTARHQGMGGAAIGYVDDPSAAFHNPGGLQGVGGFSVLADFSLLIGRVKGSPQNLEAATSIESNAVLAPFFLLGAAYRAHEWLTFGVAVFPVASGGAEYRYTVVNPLTDSTRILFIEATPVVSLDVPKDRWLPGRLAFGVGYRMSLVSFRREQGRIENPRLLNLDMTGSNFSGLRVGLQYKPTDSFGVGLVYRNKIRVVTRADEVTVFLSPAEQAELPFVLPAKFGLGMRQNFGALGLAADVEYAFQSQNERESLTGVLDGEAASVENVFAWRDGITGHFGVEYALDLGPLRVPLRAGYVFDSKVTSKQYPSAFGTPPAPTHSVTLGSGLVAQSWQLNAAVVRRMGSTTVSEDEHVGCRFCGFPGDYSIGMTGLYLDASMDFEL